MIFRFSSVEVIGETTHIGASLHSSYLNIFYSLVNITEGNTAVHAHCLIFCITARPVFYSLVNKERTWLMKQEHNWINLDFNNIMNYKNNGLVSLWWCEFPSLSYLTPQLQNSNSKWEDWLIRNLIFIKEYDLYFSEIFIPINFLKTSITILRCKIFKSLFC